MGTWLSSQFQSNAFSLSYLIAALVVGFVGALSSFTNIGMIGFLLGASGSTIGGKKYWSFGLFISGTFLAFLLIGFAPWLVSKAFLSSIVNHWHTAAGLTILLTGIVTFFPIIKKGVSKHLKIGQLSIEKPWHLVLFGALSAGVATSCCMPVLPILISTVAIQSNPLKSMVLSLFFAVGFSIPLLLVFAGLINSVNGLHRYVAQWNPAVLNKVVGLLLIGLGAMFLFF